MWDTYADDATRAVIGDWVELELHRTGRPFYTDSMLIRDIAPVSEPEQHESDRDPDAGEHGEHIDPEILDARAEDLRDQVWQELDLRQEALGDAYPFALTALRTGGWRLDRREPKTPALEYAHWMYLTTLTMSCFRNRHIRRQKKPDPQHRELQTRLEKQFQHIAALAASKYFGDDTVVYSFGWPRRDGSNFQDALRDLVDEFGNGKVKKRVPANSKGHEKDGTVDVVVWRAFTKPSAGDPLLYGQVASGDNWRDKPVSMFLKRKFLKWFKHPPTMNWLGATFMPFVKHTDVTPFDGYTMEQAIAEEDRDLAATYGQMFDRILLTELFAQGLGKPDQRVQCEDPDDVLLAAQTWIKDCFSYCDQAAG